MSVHKNSNMSKLIHLLALISWFIASESSSQDVRLVAPQTGEHLQTVLSTASLTLALQSDGADAPQDYIAAAQADYRRLLTGLYTEGFYSGTVSILIDGIEASRIDPLVPGGSIKTIILSVTTGPRFTFGRTDIQPLARGTQMPEAFTTGNIARSDDVSDAAIAAVVGWRNVGHPLAQTGGQTITARHVDEILDVSIIIAPGPKLRFGNVMVTGNEAMRTDRVLAIAGLPTGIFDPEAITRAAKNLRRTGAFTSATITEDDTPEGSTLPITIEVVEQIQRRISAGVEFSTGSGLTLAGYWLHRNLLGGAERFRIDGEIAGLSGDIGGNDYSLGTAYLRPATFRQDTNLYINANITQLDEPSFSERDASVEIGIIQHMYDDLVLGYGLGYNFGELSDDLGDRTYSLIYAPLEGTIDLRNDPLDPTSGYYSNLLVTPFVGLNGSDSGARVHGDGRIYRSFGQDDNVTIAMRGQIGSILGADAAAVPASYLFYSGGGGTVRGQPYQSLAMDIQSGNKIGGTTFLGAQLEARFNITDTIGLVGFYDTSFVGADAVPFENGDWHAGTGIGLRYNTGIGPIRLDVATPATGDNTGEKIEVYIGIGQSF
ncbi:MAG: translocation and assembly module TamA [Octadecabacter sp.]|jgi:translocation and assembly module TamA